MYRFELLEENRIPWGIIHGTYDSTIYKTKEWLEYLKLWKGIPPFVVQIQKDGETIGYFVGEVVKQVVKIIGSPFEGTGTAHQGLSMLSSTSSKERIDIYKELSKWIFKNSNALFLQVEDWQLTVEDCEGNVKFTPVDGYLIDLNKSEDELFHNLHPSSCRSSINKSRKEGVTIRETSDVDKFVEIYYDQLLEVFAKQGLTPTYDIECVRALVKALYPSKILLLEAVSLEGEVLATGLFPGDENLAVFWGGASYQRFQKLRPNEPLIWEGIIRWKARGTKTFDMCGIREYKRKFGPELYTKTRLYFSKYPGLLEMKNVAKKLYYGLRNLKAKFKK